MDENSNKIIQSLLSVFEKRKVPEIIKPTNKNNIQSLLEVNKDLGESNARLLVTIKSLIKENKILTDRLLLFENDNLPIDNSFIDNPQQIELELNTDKVEIVSILDTKSQVFMEKSILKNGSDKYDYSLLKYTKCLEPIILICVKHGKFKTSPKAHLQSEFGGCKLCSKRITNNIEKNDDENIEYFSDEEFELIMNELKS